MFFLDGVLLLPQCKRPLVLVVFALIAPVAAIVGLDVAQVVHAASSTSGTCSRGSGNPHVVDPDNPEQKANLQVDIEGNPHDIESGVTNGNPHIHRSN